MHQSAQRRSLHITAKACHLPDQAGHPNILGNFDVLPSCSRHNSLQLLHVTRPQCVDVNILVCAKQRCSLCCPQTPRNKHPPIVAPFLTFPPLPFPVTNEGRTGFAQKWQLERPESGCSRPPAVRMLSAYAISRPHL